MTPTTLIPELVTVEGNELYEIRLACRICSSIVPFRCETEPSPTALRFLAACAICDACCDAEDAKREQEENLERRGKLLANAQLPADLHGLEFGEMHVDSGRKFVVEAVRRWAIEEKPDPLGICLYGGVGRGKTRLAATAAWQRLNHGWPVRWVSMPILIANLRAAFSDKGRQQAISVLTGTGPLILDDLDKISPTEFAVSQLFAALDSRIQAGSPILVTTNYDPGTIGEKFGEPVMSRVVALEVLELPGRDNRLKLGD